MQSEELMKASTDPELQLGSDFVQAALARGDMAVGAFDGPVLVAYVWWTQTSAPHTDDIWVRVDPPYCYAYKAFARPNYRGNRLGPAVVVFSDAEILKQGFTHRVGFVATTNLKSLAARKHMSAKLTGYAGYLNWFGHFILFRTKMVRDIGFEFYELQKT